MLARKASGLFAQIGCAVVLLATVPAWGAPPLIENGNFSKFDGTCTSPGFVLLGAGSGLIPGWTVVGGNLEYICGFWESADRDNDSLDLSGSQAGSIRQVIPTVSGVKYEVVFNLAGNPDGGFSIKNLDVNVLGNALDQTESFSFDTTGQNRADMGWVEKSFTFVADSPSTDLTFTSLNAGAFGPTLDAVSVQESMLCPCWVGDSALSDGVKDDFASIAECTTFHGAGGFLQAQISGVPSGGGPADGSAVVDPQDQSCGCEFQSCSSGFEGSLSKPEIRECKRQARRLCGDVEDLMIP